MSQTCKFGNCKNKSTDEISFILTPHPSVRPVESPVVATVCPEHSFVSWKDVYTVKLWDEIVSPFRKNGMQVPIQEFSCIQIQPIKRNDE